MTASEFQWTTPDGLSIYAINHPCPKPKAVVALVHGLGEHCRRYDHVAAYFNARGFAMMAYDRRGHGQSGGKRGHAPNPEVFLDEIGHLVAEAKSVYPGLPVFLYGHSMGGNLVLAYTLKRHPEIAGVISTGPWIQLAFQPPAILVVIAKMLRHIVPAFVQRNHLKTSDLSRDKAVVEAYEKDPLVHDYISVAAATGMMETAAWLDAYTGQFPLPLLLMHGGADNITSPKASAAFAQRVPGDVTWHLWEKLYHEIHNEPEKADVLSRMTDWMEGVVSVVR